MCTQLRCRLCISHPEKGGRQLKKKYVSLGATLEIHVSYPILSPSPPHASLSRIFALYNSISYHAQNAPGN